MTRTDWCHRIDEHRVVRQYRPEDRPHIAALFAGQEGPWADPRFWDWKFSANPAGESVGSVVEADGQAVGQVGSFPVRFVVRGQEILVAHDHDMIIAPEQRTLRTLFDVAQSRMHITAAVGIEFLYGCAPEENARVLRSLIKAERVAALPLMRRRLSLEPALRRRLGSFLAPPLAAALDRVFLRSAKMRSLPAGLRLREIQCFDHRFDDLWREIRCDYQVMAIRDTLYLNWRYVDVPGLEHRIACVESDDAVLGFAVFLPGEAPRRLAQITDLVTPIGADPGIAENLVAKCLEWARETGESSVQCWMMPHCHLRGTLLDAGFFADEVEGYQLLIRRTFIEDPVDGDPPDTRPAGAAGRVPAEVLLDAESWFLSIGDADLF